MKNELEADHQPKPIMNAAAAGGKRLPSWGAKSGTIEGDA